MTLAGAVIGAISCGLWTAPAAYFALTGGYTGHGYLYVGSVVAVMALATGGMHLMGIGQERELDEAD